MVMVGELVGDIPSGWVVVAHRRTQLDDLGVAAHRSSPCSICIAAPNPLVLGVGIFLVGLATAVFALARHAFMTSYVPLAYRARALSTLGGVFRAGWFIGPFISAGVIHLTGGTQAVFWVFIVCCLAAAAVLLLLPDPDEHVRHRRSRLRRGRPVRSTPARSWPREETAGLFRTIWRYRGRARCGSAPAPA